jgi:DNA-directed RNA polymerase specialized sigma subunit
MPTAPTEPTTLDDSTLAYVQGVGANTARRYRMDRDDGAQTAVVAVLERIDRYDPSRGELRPWVCSIAIDAVKAAADSEAWHGVTEGVSARRRLRRATKFADRLAQELGRTPTDAEVVAAANADAAARWADPARSGALLDEASLAAEREWVDSVGQRTPHIVLDPDSAVLDVALADIAERCGAVHLGVMLARIAGERTWEEVATRYGITVAVARRMLDEAAAVARTHYLG